MLDGSAFQERPPRPAAQRRLHQWSEEGVFQVDAPTPASPLEEETAAESPVAAAELPAAPGSPEHTPAAEVSLLSPEGVAQVQEAAEYPVLDTFYSVQPETQAVTVHYPNDAAWEQSVAYQSLAALQERLDDVTWQLEQHEPVGEVEAEAVQHGYDQVQTAVAQVLTERQVATAPEPPVTAAAEIATTQAFEAGSGELAELTQRVFAVVDRDPGLRHLDRAAAHELLRRCEAAEPAARAAAAAQLAAFLDTIGTAPPAPERTSLQADQLLADYEDQYHGQREALQAVRALHGALHDTLQERVDEPSPVDQLLAVKAWQQRVGEQLQALQQFVPPQPTGRLERLVALHGAEVGRDIYDAEQAAAALAATTAPEPPAAATPATTAPAQPAPAPAPAPARRKTLIPQPLDAPATIAIDASRVQASATTEAQAGHAAWDDMEREAAAAPAKAINHTSDREAVQAAAAARRERKQSRREQLGRLRRSEINMIESGQQGWLDRTLNVHNSPYDVLGDWRFPKVAQLLQLGKTNSAELRSRLEALNVRYEVFDAWVERQAELRQLVPDADRLTFREAVDRYVTALQGADW